MPREIAGYISYMSGMRCSRRPELTE